VAAEADFQPAITRWGHAWRIALVLATSAIVWGGAKEDGAFDGRATLIAVDLGLGVAGFVAVVFRRRHPLPVAAATSALMALSATASGPAALAMTSLATRRKLRPLVVAAAVNVVASTVYVIAVSPKRIADADQLVGIVVPLAAMVGWGLFVGARRELLWNLRQRAERAEAEQELRAAEAKAHERTRIAREMHDVVAHRISQVSMRAGALAFRDDLSADQMRAESEIIRDAANTALRELRSVLEVLRDPSSGAPIERPQPTQMDVAGLVADARRAGVHIELEQAITLPVPTETGRTLYRIVQEGITNASKHAPGARLQIRLADDAGGVALTMANRLGFGAASTPGSGLGLVGIAERVAVAGGRFEREERDGQFTVRAWLPCPT
jgi:signal transduction histidine kinase